jgi:hypothetical protein
VQLQVLIQGLEAIGLDFGIVDKDVAVRVVGGDKAEALFSVEPLDGSLSHLFLLINGTSQTCTLYADLWQPGEKKPRAKQ